MGGGWWRVALFVFKKGHNWRIRLRGLKQIKQTATFHLDLHDDYAQGFLPREGEGVLSIFLDT